MEVTIEMICEICDAETTKLILNLELNKFLCNQCDIEMKRECST